MEKSNIPERNDGEKLTPREDRIVKLRLAVICILVLAALIWMMTGLEPAFAPTQSQTSQEERSASFQLPRARERGTSQSPTAESVQPVTGLHAPKKMKLDKRVLVSSEWNSSPNAFGLDKPLEGQEGATVGPSSIAYANGNIYVLDNVNKRVLRYDESGNLLASISLPTKGATDITTDSLGAVVVIDHYHDRIYKIEGDVAILVGSTPTKKEFPIGTKFYYDSASNTLTAKDVDTDGLAKIDGNNLIVALQDGKEMSIPFESPVACVEEVMTDAQGIVWVLYTLEGDYRMRRVARVDPARGSVGVAELDVWFAFDATRHMAPAQNGIVLFAGDGREGRLISFDYAGQ